MQVKYRRILLKLSGEALMGEDSFGISTTVIDFVASEIKAVAGLGVEIGLVIGAGNIFRGVAGASKGMDRSTADNMGMLATVINGLALQDALEDVGCVQRREHRLPGGRCGASAGGYGREHQGTVALPCDVRCDGEHGSPN